MTQTQHATKAGQSGVYVYKVPQMNIHTVKTFLRKAETIGHTAEPTAQSDILSYASNVQAIERSLEDAREGRIVPRTRRTV